jgi:hypothetical protein
VLQRGESSESGITTPLWLCSAGFGPSHRGRIMSSKQQPEIDFRHYQNADSEFKTKLTRRGEKPYAIADVAATSTDDFDFERAIPCTIGKIYQHQQNRQSSEREGKRRN